MGDATLAGDDAPSTGPAAARQTVWLRACLAERLVQAAVGLVLAAALGLGVVLEPSPTGTDTHCALGLPPCGMLKATGHPCPTCGVTTSFVLAAHGRLGDAFVNQPFGLVCFLVAAGGLALTVAALATGRSWAPLLGPWSVSVVAAVLAVLALVSWAYKWSTM